MSSRIVAAFSRFPSWVPQSSAVVNALILLTSFSTATVLGYDASMMNALNILPSYVDYFSLSAATIGLNSGIVWIGAILGSMVLAKLPDHIGRKPALFYTALIAIIGSLLQGAAQNIAMFLVARFILGFGLGGTYVAGPLLIAETLPLKWRAIGLGAFTDLYYAGGLLSAGVTFGTAKFQSTWAWRLPSLLQIALTVISLMALPWIPESPRYLVHKGREQEALLVVAQTHSNGDISAPEAQAALLQISQSWELERNIERPTVKQIAKTPGLRKRMIIVFSAAAFSQLTGAGLFSYYLGSALTNAGVTDSTTQLQINIILNSFCLVVSIAGTLLSEKLGRKVLAEISTAGCTIFLILIGVLTKYYGNSTNTSAIYATVAMIFLAQGSYSFAWTPLATIYPSEVLNYSLRSVGVAWFTIWQNGFLLIPIFAFPIAMESIGWIIYILNSVFDFAAIFFIAWYWVETKGLSLEEISGLFEPQTSAELIGVDEAIEKAKGKGVDVLEIRPTRATDHDVPRSMSP
ncbi:sugar transporter domain-containing protein [Sarocladium implicatum]|nr:sugar transporter domain-containing protein [Sarocladium implicatum]